MAIRVSGNQICSFGNKRHEAAVGRNGRVSRITVSLPPVVSQANQRRALGFSVVHEDVIVTIGIPTD
jgi:hypothetical protein